jgi:hypothetical protein
MLWANPLILKHIFKPSARQGAPFNSTPLLLSLSLDGIKKGLADAISLETRCF